MDKPEAPRPTTADSAAIDAVRGRLHDELRLALRGRTEAILLDAPLHGNAGDLLIARGLMDSLRSIGVRLTMIQDWRLTSWQWLHRIPQTTAVLFMGGGNVGGLYPARDRYRARVLDCVPGEQVVLLPQSVSVADGSQARGLREAYGDHPEAVYLIRDRLSAARLVDAVPSLSHSIRHAPDLAFGADLTAVTAPSTDIRILKRDDHEAIFTSLIDLPAGVRAISSDWPTFAADNATSRGLLDFVQRRERFVRAAGRLPGAIRSTTVSLIERSWAPKQQRLLREHVMTSVEIMQVTLAQGRIVVTDRLHAHLGAALLGIPNVVLGSIDGKAHALIRDWTEGLSTTHVASGPDDASAIVRRLFSDAAPRP